MKELQKLVKRLGNQARAARRLKVSYSQVSEWLSGKRTTPDYIEESARSANELLDAERGGDA